MLLNPTFRDLGLHSGEAAHWTLRTVCQAHRIAAFGPITERAVEDFERWFELRNSFGQGDIAIAMFDALAEGYEDFEEGWNGGPLLTQLTGGNADPALFDGNDVDDMEAGWLSSPFVSAWSDVIEEVAEFDGISVERFETWTSPTSVSWPGAMFDGGTIGAETFAGTWIPMQTL